MKLSVKKCNTCDYEILGFHKHCRRGRPAFHEEYRRIIYEADKPLTTEEVYEELKKKRGSNFHLDTALPQKLTRDAYIKDDGKTKRKEIGFFETHFYSQYNVKLWTHKAKSLEAVVA
jgi:hypothetical protein